jgi:hypothetical protein
VALPLFDTYVSVCPSSDNLSIVPELQVKEEFCETLNGFEPLLAGC